MKISVIGAGYVGLVSAACFAQAGHSVKCYDCDHKKIVNLSSGIIPIFEPGLTEMIQRNLQNRQLRFFEQIQDCLQDVQAVFIAVGTPTRRGDGHADLSYVLQSTQDVCRYLDEQAIIVIKSTVPVGTNALLTSYIQDLGYSYNIASNPEFLREGAAIEDFQHPDRIVVGVQEQETASILKEIYAPLNLPPERILVTTPESAEMIKYASNAFLATKITFINQISDLCEVTNANIVEVAKGMGFDHRIGADFLKTGPGYGGSCFPKDTLALLQTAKQKNIKLDIIEVTAQVNKERKSMMAQRIIAACGGCVQQKVITIWGITFKPGTDDIRDAPSLIILPALQEAGAIIRWHDPQGHQKELQEQFPTMDYCADFYEAAQGADCCVLLTEWPEYSHISPTHLAQIMRGNVIIDLRNLWLNMSFPQAGFDYHPMGMAAKKRAA